MAATSPPLRPQLRRADSSVALETTHKPPLGERVLRKSDSTTAVLETGSPRVAQRLLSKINEKRRSFRVSFDKKKDENVTTLPDLPPFLHGKSDEELLTGMPTSGGGGRSRSQSVSVTEVGNALRGVEETLYQLEVEEIWQVVEGNWAEWGRKKGDLARILYRKGVPQTRIGEIWHKLSKLIPNTQFIMCPKEDSPEVPHSCLYHQLLEMSSTYEPQITADIHRTFPDQDIAYNEKFQKSLFNVLKAFSLYDETVGYCQGLSFVAALLLMKVPEEQAFYILSRLLKGHDLRSFYTEDMRGVQLRVFQMNRLIQQLFPQMYNHLEKLEVKTSLMLIPWFMTAFTYQLPIAVAFRVMNTLLLEGIPAFFRIALSLLLICEQDIMGLDETGIMEYFRSDMKAKFTSPTQLMNIAYAVNVSMPQLEQMELDFLQHETSPPPPFDGSSPGSPPKEKVKVSQLLVENHELREKTRQAEEALSDVQTAFDSYRRKAENEKLSLIRRLSIVSESLEAALSEKKEMKAKMGRSEKDMDNMQQNIAELMKSNVMLSEELRGLTGQTTGNGHAPFSPRDSPPPETKTRKDRSVSIW